MNDLQLTFKIKFSWWVFPYLFIAKFLVRFKLIKPNFNRIASFILLGTKVTL